MEKVKKFAIELLERKIYWLPASQIDMVKKEAKRQKLKNDSVLMRHIINNWFKK